MIDEPLRPKRIEEFILAGKSKFTLKSTRTGKHYTFKCRKGDGDIWFIKRLIEDNDYIYLGTLFPDGFMRTKASPPGVREDWEAFNYFWERLRGKGLIPKGIEFYHASRCGMCGLELTDPLSIKEGYGPECRKKKLHRSFNHD
jgi:hypothetical protein